MHTAGELVLVHKRGVQDKGIRLYADCMLFMLLAGKLHSSE